VEIVHLIVLAGIAVLLAVLVAQTMKIRRQNAKLEAAVAPLRAEAVRAPDAGALPGPGRFLTIEILNPSELARAENKFAPMASAVAPRLLTQIVYAKAAGILREQLAERGVEADVKIHVR
jgi:predicted cobalt transporter CbtA